MSVLHKVKVFFALAPADEAEEYDDDTYRDRYEANSDEHYDAPADRIGGWRRGRRGTYSSELGDEGEDFEDFQDFSESPRSRRQWSSDAPVRGSLAVDSQREPVSRLRAVTDTGTQYNLSKITTLHPRSYSEARTIGEQYRDGTPVIMNLTEMDEADAKRLVDFAAGLAFAMRGSIEKVTNRVFLLSPPNLDVAAEDKRRLAEGAFFNYG